MLDEGQLQFLAQRLTHWQTW